MKIKFICTLTLLLISFIAIANDKTHFRTENGIPYFVYTITQKNITSSQNTIPYSDTVTVASVGNTGTSSTPAMSIGINIIEGVINYFKPETLESKIKQLKTTICGAAGNADAKVWFILGENGKVGIGNPEVVSLYGNASKETGIEVTFHCTDKQ